MKTAYDKKVVQFRRNRIRLRPKSKTRKSIQIGADDNMLRRVDERTGHRIRKRSVRLYEDCNMYHAAIDYVMPQLWEIFTVREAGAILQAFEGSIVDYVTAWMWAEGGLYRLLANRFRTTDLCEDFKVDGDEILEKVANLTEMQMMGVVDMLSVFWIMYDSGGNAKEYLLKFMPDERDKLPGESGVFPIGEIDKAKLNQSEDDDE